MSLLRDFEIIVIKADEAEADHHEQHDPDIAAREIGPQQRRDDEPRQNHEAAHRRRAFLCQKMRLRTISADRLALALFEAQGRNGARAEKEDEEQRRRRRAAGAKGDVTKKIERTEQMRKIRKPSEHEKKFLGDDSWSWIARFQRFDDGMHAAGVGPFDHDEITGTNGVAEGRFKLLGCRPPSALELLRQSVVESLHHRPGGENDIDMIDLQIDRKARMEIFAARPEFAHIAEHGDAASRFGGRRQFADERESRPHGGGIGVVAFVDEREGAFARRQRETPAASFGHIEGGERLRCFFEIERRRPWP